MAAVDASRQPAVSGTAFAVRDAWPWPTLTRLAALGDELGYGAVFLPEIAGRDAIAALTGLADSAPRLLLGTGVVPMTSRRPALTAMGVATLQERSEGRAILGLGTGRARAGALDELRAQVLEIRSRLDAMTDPDATAGLVLDRPVPIWIAALGPRAVALAGAIADGVLLNWCTPERVSEARARLEEAADDAGREPASITVAAYIRAAVEDDPASEAGARRALAVAAGEYATYPAYRRQFDAMEVGAAAAAAAAGVGETPPEAVQPLLERVCLTGDAPRARARMEEYRRAGCDLPVVYPVPFGADGQASVARTLRALAPSR
jgi:5,10-methylenetetrahydromethanopterin reductase